jgi:MFS family permease
LSRIRDAQRTGPLGVRSFRLLAAGQFGSTLGDYCYAVALPWLVLSNHGSPATLGAVLACFGVPRAAATPIGGILADRLPPRLIMLAVDIVRCGLAAAMVILAINHIASLAALGPLAAVIGVAAGLFLAPSSSIIPHLVEPGQLQAANLDLS